MSDPTRPGDAPIGGPGGPTGGPTSGPADEARPRPGEEPVDPTPPPDPPEVGSVGEEAAKLIGALSDWARDSGGDLGSSLHGLAGHAATSLSELNEHIATGAPECTYCPVCRTVHVVRQASPEVKAHLTTAASSLLQALAGALATVPPPPSASGRGSDIEKIDLDGDET